jgi:hypothetical protein
VRARAGPCGGWGTNPRVRARRQAIPTSAANTFWAPPYRYHLSSVTTHTTLFFQPPSRGFSYEVSMADTEIEEDSLDREGPESNRQSTSDLLEAPKQRPAHRQRLKRKSSTVTSGTRLFVEGNSTSPWARRYRDLITTSTPSSNKTQPRPRYGATLWSGTQTPFGSRPVCQNTSIGMPPRGYQ